jgi:hypothetical protein
MNDPILATIGLVFLLVPAIIAIWTAVWAYGDAKVRGKPPILVALLVLVAGWPVSLLIWIVFRPDKKRPPFDLNNFRVR